MMHQALALMLLMRRCAPEIAPSSMAAIIGVESRGDPLAIGDNTAKRSYHPRNRASAEALAQRLLRIGHSLDLGMAQIDDLNFAHFRVNLHTIFDPCTNLSVGARILAGDYAIAERRFGSGQIALRHAIGMYNSGRLDGGARYVTRVLAAGGVRDGDNVKSHIAWMHGATQAPTRVGKPSSRYQKSPPSSRIMTPFRSPILVTAAQTSRLTVF